MSSIGVPLLCIDEARRRHRPVRHNYLDRDEDTADRVWSSTVLTDYAKSNFVVGDADCLAYFGGLQVNEVPLCNHPPAKSSHSRLAQSSSIVIVAAEDHCKRRSHDRHTGKVCNGETEESRQNGAREVPAMTEDHEKGRQEKRSVWALFTTNVHKALEQGSTTCPVPVSKDQTEPAPPTTCTIEVET